MFFTRIDCGFARLNQSYENMHFDTYVTTWSDIIINLTQRGKRRILEIKSDFFSASTLIKNRH